ncbi:hypothetical protein EDC94DRAFT_662053 [Helicostylum pulchrum]|nr:hypothetical protein EDC94DRAFT_662053 [Helicostylum pulchrum]
MFAISAMMQAKSEEQLEPFTTSFIEIFPVFVAYFKSIWLERKTLQEKAWRPKASYHMSNMIESHHTPLKSFYLTRSRNKLSLEVYLY